MQKTISKIAIFDKVWGSIIPNLNFLHLSSWTISKISVLVHWTNYFHSSPEKRSKASSLHLSACVNVHVSAAYHIML